MIVAAFFLVGAVVVPTTPVSLQRARGRRWRQRRRECVERFGVEAPRSPADHAGGTDQGGFARRGECQDHLLDLQSPTPPARSGQPAGNQGNGRLREPAIR